MSNNPKEIFRDFKGIWIPKEIWFDNSLTFFEKCLLAEIDSLDGKDHCYADNDYFCNFFNINQKTLSRALTKLKNLGFIYEVSFNGRTRKLGSNLGKNGKDKFDQSAKELQNLRTEVVSEPTQKCLDALIYNNKEDNINSNVPDSKESTTTQKIEPTSEASKMARYLLMKRDKHFPKMKQPRIDGWIKELDLMNRRDGRSWDEIKAAIDFAMEDSFWCKNILSAETLRKQYDKLYAKMTPVENKGSIEEKNKEKARSLLNYLISKDQGKRMQIYKEYIFIPEIGEKILYSINPETFDELLFKYLGVKKKK